LIAINKIKYKIKVDIIAAADKDNIIPVLSQLKNLIFLLKIFAMIFKKILIKVTRLFYLGQIKLTKLIKILMLEIA